MDYFPTSFSGFVNSYGGWQPQVTNNDTPTMPTHDLFDGFQPTSSITSVGGGPVPNAYSIVTAPSDIATNTTREQQSEPIATPHKGPLSEKFEEHRNEIQTYYPLMELKHLKAHMQREHRFTASEQQWKRQLDAWGLSKNIPRRVSMFIAKKNSRRRVQEKKKTYFKYRGNPVSAVKVQRYTRNYSANPSSPTGSVPSDLTFGTCPSPHALSIDPMRDTNGEDPEAPSHGRTGLEFLHDRDMDKFLELHGSAVRKADSGDYMSAKPVFMEAFEGLEFLLGPTHNATLRVLADFAKAAMEFKDYGEALQRLFKSWTDHKELLGESNKKTWESYAQLGHVYLGQGKPLQALEQFLDARRGLQESTRSEPEDSFKSTSPISEQIITLTINLGHLEEAENEIRQQIAQADSLGESYIPQVASLKHHLVHLYNHKDWAQGGLLRGVTNLIPTERVEQLLREVMRTFQETCTNNDTHLGTYLCTLEDLRIYYESTGSVEKLRSHLSSIECVLNRLPATERGTVEKSLTLMMGVSESFTRLYEYGLAQCSLLHRQKMIDSSPFHGPDSHEALSNNKYLVKLQETQPKPQDAIPFLKRAQEIVNGSLPPGHHIHDMIQKILADDTLSPANM